MYMPMPIMMMLETNGMRQPQASNCSGVSTEVRMRMKMVASSMPAGTPTCG